MDANTRPNPAERDDSRSQLLLDSITDYAIYMLDVDGFVASWNTGAQRFKGYLPHEIIGQHFSAFYTDADRNIGLPAVALQTALRTGKFEAEGWRIRKDGSRFWAHVVIDPIRDSTGRHTGFAKITRDLSEKKQAEDELKRSERQFRLLVQSVTDYAIYMLDPQGLVTSWNAGAERIKGYKAEEVIGTHFSRFYIPEDLRNDGPRLALESAVRDGRYEKEGWRLRKDGKHFRANVVIDPIYDDDGSLIGFTKITRDITEREEARAALDRTREALFQSQKTEAVGQLTGGIAHDFNNLLAAIMGSLELAQKRLPYNARISPLIENALQGARRGSSLTQRMLAFARRQALSIETIELGSLLRGMQDLLQSSLGPMVTLERRFPINLDTVRSDPAQLEAAILNLVVNARDAMPNGGTVTIAARCEDIRNDADMSEGRYVCVSVTDTGSGMDAETLRRATEPFFTTKGVGKGTGLGLPMAYGVAAQSGGKLKIKSRLGQGTTAELWMPVVDPKLHPFEKAGAPQPQTEVEKLVVLAVDDDPLVLLNTSEMLQDLGHTVLEASSAKQALGLLNDHPDIDVLITDQSMPNMTGAELARVVLAEHRSISVIIATGYAELPPGVADGIVRLSKPFPQEELSRSLAKVRRPETR